MKLTVNLEKALIKQNKKILSAKELLKVNEFEKHEKNIKNNIDFSALQRIGCISAIEKGKKIKKEVESNKNQTLPFDQSRVVHISQIKSLCLKYNLRFLQASLYKGDIDEQLPFKVNMFELAHGVKCYGDERVVAPNTFIMAPKESFSLQEKPKDPLMFYKINDEYFYLIHKWGNDLNIFRRISTALFSNSFFCWLLVISPSLYMFYRWVFGDGYWVFGDGYWWGIGSLFLFFIANVLCFSPEANDDIISIPFIRIKKNWNSKFKD